MATLEQVFQREKAWIAASDDVDALIEKIGDYREDVRVAERDGHMLMRMRAGDLIELAQSRVVRLQAGGMRKTEPRSTPEAPPPAVPTVRPAEVPRHRAVDRAPALRTDDGAARRDQARRDAELRVKTEAALAEAERAKAAARVAEAEAAKIEAQTALLRAQTEAAARAAVAPAPPTTTARPRSPVRLAPLETHPSPASPPTKKAARPPAPAQKPATPSQKPTTPRDDGYTEADRLALASVGHWPPTAPDHRGAFWSKHDDWPRDWTLTGGDLGRFRGEVNLTRAVFAAQLGVPSAVVKDAEMSPRERVGPALQIALRRAMEQAAAERRRRQKEREAPAAKPEPAVAAEVATVTPVAPPSAAAPEAPASAPAAFTGTDLARLRAERRLSQREMADLLGVEQGTISKGEAKARAAVGPALQEAMRRLGAKAATAAPE